MKNSQDKYKLLFVCLGNICRSPAADGVMQKLVEDAGLSDRIFIDSAGFGDWHVGDLPDRRMREAGMKHGYTFNHHARLIDKENDLDRFDKILVMDRANHNDVMSIAVNSEQEAKVEYLGSYFTKHVGQLMIPDPYYGKAKDFDYVIELLEDACPNLLEEVKRLLNS